MYKDDWEKLEIPEMVGSAGTRGVRTPLGPLFLEFLVFQVIFIHQKDPENT